MSTMLSQSYRVRDALTALSLTLISFFFVPLGAFILAWSFFTRSFQQEEVARRRCRQQPGFKPRVVLVSGFGTTSGLALARSLYQAGHTPIGADWESEIETCNRFSYAIRAFYTLPRPTEKNGPAWYAQELIRIIGRENVDLWISCSGDVAQDAKARRVIECTSNRKFRSLQFDAETVELFSHKDSFLAYLPSVGLPAAETHRVNNRASVHRILNGSNGGSKKYTLRNSAGDHLRPSDVTLLPRRTLSQTYQTVSQVPVTTETPFLLEEVITGATYRTQALVVRDEIRAFAASPDFDKTARITALPGDATLNQAMLRYANQLLARTGRGLSGFLGMTFTVKERVTEKGIEQLLYASECHLHPDAAGLGLYCAGAELGQRIVEALPPTQVNGVGASGTHEAPVLYPVPHAKYYNFGHEVLTMVLRPLRALLGLEMGVTAFVKSALAFAECVVRGQDASFEWWDPLPWWSAYQLYWPLRLVKSVLDQKPLSKTDMGLLEMH